MWSYLALTSSLPQPGPVQPPHSEQAVIWGTSLGGLLHVLSHLSQTLKFLGLAQYNSVIEDDMPACT